MLTPAEKREKKMRKMFDETGVEELTAVYRCGGVTPVT
jgi:prolyl-tRNA editing enzyme YbaK/EbsC (Cys-tRNA(Pro) deacylase)